MHSLLSFSVFASTVYAEGVFSGFKLGTMQSNSSVNFTLVLTQCMLTDILEEIDRDFPTK